MNFECCESCYTHGACEKSKNCNLQPSEVSLDCFVLPLDLAMIRWSVKCTAMNELASGAEPLLGPFLAGWYWRCMGNDLPPKEAIKNFRDSFRMGWGEADTQVIISLRENAESEEPSDE